MPDRRDLLITLILLIIAFVVRYLGIFMTCMVGDEWLYWTKTNMILANNWQPVPEVFECSPPVLPHICAFFAMFFGSDLYVFRTISAVFGALTVPAMYLFTKEMYDRKTALISALIVCFTAYHCYYSRIYKLDAFTIFLISLFLYYFWLCEKYNRRIYVYLTGIFLGLAVSAKYLPAFLAGSILIYYFWIYGIRKNIIKKLLVIYFFAFLSFLPLLIGLFVSGAGLQPFYYYTIGMFQRGGVAKRPIQYFTLGSLIEMGLEKVCEVLVYGVDLTGQILSSIVKLSTLIVLIVVELMYLYWSLKKDRRSSFLFASTLCLGVVLLVMRISKYYLLYLLPFYAPMVAFIFVKILETVVRGRNYVNVLCYLFITLFIFYFSYVIVSGFTSSNWDKGEYSWAMDAIKFIKVDSINIQTRYHRPIIIGTFIFVNEPIEYNAFICNLSVEVYNLGIVKPYPEQSMLAVIKQINLLKPDYIIMVMEPISFYGMFFKGKLKEEILKNYNIAYITDTYPYKALILKRKHIAPHICELPKRVGYIDHDFFVKSVPPVLRQSKAYTVKVKIRNIKYDCSRFTIRLHSNKFLIYIYHRFQNVTLNRGESAIVSYKVLAMKHHLGRVPIYVDVYLGSINQSLNNVLDTDVRYVRLFCAN